MFIPIADDARLRFRATGCSDPPGQVGPNLVHAASSRGKPHTSASPGNAPPALRWYANLYLLAAMLAATGDAGAAVIKFDEFAATNINGAIAPNTYAQWGVTFDGTDDGSTWDGTSRGDPGGWGVEGTAGSVFSGHNGGSYSNRMVFDTAVRSFAIDISGTGGSTAGDTFTLEGWSNNALVESRSFTLDGVDQWQTAVLFSTVDEVRWSGNGAGFHPFAVDNARWTNTHTSRVLFDEYPAQNANGAVAQDYSALDLNITGSDDGSTWEGTTQGDPGGWSVEGSNGSVFSGHNGNSYADTFTFAADVKHVAVDVSRTGGSSAGDTVTLEGWNNGVMVESKTVALDAVDTWRTATLLETVDEVRVLGAGGSFHPFALDNLRWTTPDAGVILFDEFAADNSNGAIPLNRYIDWGVSFVGVDDGSTWDGQSRGDPGGWGTEGTNGSIFAGFNGGDYGLTLLFDGIIEEFMLDVARSGGSSTGDTFTLSGYLQGLLVDSITAELTNIDTWVPFLLAGAIDEVRLFGTGSGFHPFGIDNLNWIWVQRGNGSGNNVPTPGTLALLLGGLAGVWLRRQRSHN